VKRYWPLLKRILTDAAGVALIVAAIFLGWLPGISGIPLFLAGLGLLAINNNWAQQWLRHIRNHGSQIANAMFTTNPTIMLLDDILSLLICLLSVSILWFYDGYIVRTVAFIFLTLGITIFLLNRKRLQRLSKIVRK
jgi:hypothetical protein